MSKKGRLPQQVMKRIEDFFSCDYKIVHVWITHDENFLITVHQYNKIFFVSCYTSEEEYGWDIQLDHTYRMKE